ncbi:hypothetical protein [Pseudonocardia humida]|uniref:Cell division protein FtsL n=1 Tax=Pseudonocardia humida TaxID=2800819 RepID=A0ABT0ZYV2_9PSEU|nr:hypothetical protein [Pseudonocardia humida]MCO1655886.1 hypothetical protein [Pseudonocardia humida]
MSVRTPSRERVRTGSTAGRTTARGRTPALPAQREAAPTRARAATTATETATPTASQRAYARREERLRRLVGAARPARPGAVSTGRAKFVLLIMLLLIGGLVATLWLSTSASADSYRLQDAKSDAAALSQRSEQLRREVAQLASAPELARRAEEMGMVRVQDPARLVVGPDGAVTVVGEPQAAPAPAPPVVSAAPPAGAQVGVQPGASGPGTPLAGAPGAGTPEAATSEEATQGDGAAGAAGEDADETSDPTPGTPAGADGGDAPGGTD